MAADTSRRAATPPLAEPSAWRSVGLRVNGEQVDGDVESRLTLADFLRRRLALTGTHLGCEHGVCGACTVLLDDLPVRACLVLAVQADGREVRTVEGLAGTEDPLTPVQEAFHRCHGMQCGFCTPGLLMTTTSLVERSEAPDDDDVADHVSGHLCRCTGYAGVREAVTEALVERFGDGGR